MVLTREYVDVPVGERAMRTFVAAPAAAGLLSRRRLLLRHLPAHRADAALGGAARRLRLRGRRARDLPPHRAGRHRARVRRRGQGARAGRRRRDPGRRLRRGHRGGAGLARASAARRSARPGTARAGHLRSARRSTRACARRRCWYPTGLHDGKLGKDADGLAGARGRDRRRDAADLRHARSAHAAAGARGRCARGLEAAGTRFSWSEYDAEHAFGRDIGPRFDPEATDRAFAETVAFFRRTL